MFSEIVVFSAFLTLASLAAFAGTGERAADVPASAEKSKIATPVGWFDDFEKAQKLAEKSGRDLLVAFSGSDWCSWCMILESEVLSKKSFTEIAGEIFVPVYIDFPRDKERLSPAAKRQNAGLVARYRIGRFPAVLLLDADGDIIAQSGYIEGGPEVFFKKIRTLLTNGKKSPEYQAQKALRKIPKTDENRIFRLDTILKTLPIELQITNGEYVREILAHDADGSRGFRKNYPYFTDVLPLEHALKAECKRLAKLTEDALTAHGKPKEKAEYVKIIVELVRANSEPLLALRERTRETRKRFAANSPEAERLDKILAELERIFSLYIKNTPVKSPKNQDFGRRNQ